MPEFISRAEDSSRGGGDGQRTYQEALRLFGHPDRHSGEEQDSDDEEDREDEEDRRDRDSPHWHWGGEITDPLYDDKDGRIYGVMVSCFPCSSLFYLLSAFAFLHLLLNSLLGALAALQYSLRTGVPKVIENSPLLYCFLLSLALIRNAFSPTALALAVI